MNTRHGPGKPFVPGNRHGKGRPAGSRNKASLELQELLEGEGPAIMRKLIRLAKAGNERALRLCLERLIPPCRERRVQITLPLNVTTAEGVSGTLAAILTAATQGEITLGEAVQLAEVVEIRRKTIETEEFERRLIDIEKREEQGPGKKLSDQADDVDSTPAAAENKKRDGRVI